MKLFAGSSQRRDLLAVVSLVLFAALGHGGSWLGWSQPVGGDKTHFSYGLMGFYSQCLAAGEAPLWNPLWGFGFPGLAESQMGAFYGPHVVLYWLLPVIDAFRWNFLLHRTALAATTYISCRGMRLRPLGAWVASLATTTGGFALNHLDHQWAVESLVWMPLVLWATQSWIKSGPKNALPLLVAVQLSIGHFQVAFMTLVGAAILVVAHVVFCSSPSWRMFRRFGGWLLAIGLGFGIASVQLIPTAHLASFVRSVNPHQGTPDYLSTHGMPIWMTANLGFPYLYHREPLWRDVVWTPVRSAPEECLWYVGLLPLVCAFGALIRRRRSPFVRSWACVLIVASLLGWAPYLPGFETLVQLPGFSLFRAFARWNCLSSFALLMLAGYAIDRMRRPRQLWRWWRNGVVVWILALVALSFWWHTFDSAARTGDSPPSWTQQLLMWAGVTGPVDLTGEMRTPKTPDAYTLPYWRRLGRAERPTRLIDRWGDVLYYELAPTIGLVALTTVLLLANRRLAANSVLIVLVCLVDFSVFRFVFSDKIAPMDQLQPDRGFLQTIAKLPKGTRITGVNGNLLQAWGAAPVIAYRTLDVPMPTAVQQACFQPDARRRSITSQLVGLDAIVAAPLVRGGEGWRVFDDVQLLWWQDGELLAPERQAKTGLRTIGSDPLNAVLVPLSADPAQPVNSEIADANATLNERDRCVRVWDVATTAPARLLIGEMYAPGWSAELIQGDEVTPATVERGAGYWQSVVLPRAGLYRVRLTYTAPGFYAGGAVSIGSIGAWVVWILLRRRGSGLAGLRKRS